MVRTLRLTRTVSLPTSFLALMGIAALPNRVQSAPQNSASKIVASSAQTATQAQEILNRRCLPCHRAGGNAGQTNFILASDGTQGALNHETVQLILSRVQSATMPPQSPPPSSESNLLRQWVEAGAPPVVRPSSEAARDFITEENILMYIFLDSLHVGAVNRPYIRYVSLAHLYNAGVPEPVLKQYRVAMAKLFNSLSWRPRVYLPTPLEHTNNTVFRIDLRDYGWSLSRWEAIEKAYPYDYSAPNKAESLPLWTSRYYTQTPPYLHGDWLVHNASVAPLYYDLLDSPETLQELEVKVLHPSDVLKRRAGLTKSLVSRNSRVLEHRDSDQGSYWRSYDYRNNQNKSYFFQNPQTLVPAGGEFIYSLPNGFLAYFLADGKGKRLDEAPVDIVSDYNFPGDPVVRNGRSCMGCHSAGVRPFKDNVRKAIQEGLFAVPNAKEVLELYSPQDVLDYEVDQDNGRFQEAMHAIYSRAANDALNEPVSTLARAYSSRLTLTSAASEIGLKKEDFEKAIRENVRVRQLGMGQFLVAPYLMNRDTWEAAFPSLVPILRLQIHSLQEAYKH